MDRRDFLRLTGVFFTASNKLGGIMKLAEGVSAGELFANAPSAAYLQEALAPLMPQLKAAQRHASDSTRKLIRGLMTAEGAENQDRLITAAHMAIDNQAAAEAAVFSQISPKDYHNINADLLNFHTDMVSRVAAAYLSVLKKTPDTLITSYGGRAQNIFLELKRMANSDSVPLSQTLETISRSQGAMSLFGESLPDNDSIGKEIRAITAAYKARRKIFDELFEDSPHLREYICHDFFGWHNFGQDNFSRDPKKFWDYMENPDSIHRARPLTPLERAEKNHQWIKDSVARADQGLDEWNGCEKPRPPLSDFYTPVDDESLNLRLLKIAVEQREKSGKDTPR